MARISARELIAWQVYEQREGPLGPRRDDHLTAFLATAVRNTFIDKKSKAAKPKDFLPDWTAREEVDEEADPDDGERS